MGRFVTRRREAFRFEGVAGGADSNELWKTTEVRNCKWEVGDNFEETAFARTGNIGKDSQRNASGGCLSAPPKVPYIHRGWERFAPLGRDVY